jgi:hypothetical protein
MLVTLISIGLAIVSFCAYVAIYSSNRKLHKTFIGRYAITDLPLSNAMIKAAQISIIETPYTKSTNIPNLLFNNAYDALMYVNSRLQQMDLSFVDVYCFDDGAYYIESPKTFTNQIIDIKSIIIATTK